ncbi:MAG: DUF815 domain-containing protein [Firmicutes bacterium]|nr:DUF815 domain-containing protein [Bacillota bacterium]
MNEKLLEIKNKLSLLSVFGDVLDTPLIYSLNNMLYGLGIEYEEMYNEQTAHLYGEFCSETYKAGGDLALAVRDIILKEDNPYLEMAVKEKQIPASLAYTAKTELALFNEIAKLTADDFKDEIKSGIELPRWKNSDVDIAKSFFDMIASIKTKGYGIFARANVFKVADDGELAPIMNADILPLSSLYGYKRERSLVLDNTLSLAEGGNAANVLLYGDAGTGKSTTIKACAAACFDKGLRLVEFKKNQLKFIPALTEKLADTPLKFIFYIDDLSFRADDDDFCFLKGILEGDVSGNANNIRIYASSNRRHLMRESFDARTGSEIHLNDTLQETMSLSDRFGLTITFSKPEKDLYIEIVENLAAEYGIKLPYDELVLGAEAFAIRTNGRSPRTAKQYIMSLTVEHKS